MPYARKRTRRRKPRRRRRAKYKKSKTSNQITLIKSPTNGGFPKSMFTTLKFVHNGSLNPGVAGANAIQVFRANSLYDPDYSGAGGQPRGFDQWMEIYDHYYVKRARIYVDFHNGDGSYEVAVGVNLRDTPTTEAVALEYQEQMGTYQLLGRVGSSKAHCRVKRSFDWKSQSYSHYTDDENKGSASGNPSENHLFHVWCGSPWGQDSANCYYTATIYYDVLFTELKDILAS